MLKNHNNVFLKIIVFLLPLHINFFLGEWARLQTDNGRDSSPEVSPGNFSQLTTTPPPHTVFVGAPPSPHIDGGGHHGGEELLRGRQELWGDAGVQERAVPCPMGIEKK